MSALLTALGAETFEAAFEQPAREALETAALPAFLCRQRWFGSKTRAIRRVHVRDGGPLLPPLTPFLLIVDVEYEDGGTERYALPLTMLSTSAATALLGDRPNAPIAWLDRPGGRMLVDGLADDNACRGLLAAIDARKQFGFIEGVVSTHRDERTVVDGPIADVAVRRTGAEQSNSSVLFGRHSILKVYRRLEPGVHPEIELGRYLRRAGFADVPALLGSMEYTQGGVGSALAVLHALVPDATDGWAHALEQAAEYYRRVADLPASQAAAATPAGTLLEVASRPLPDEARHLAGDYLACAETLGSQTAALHVTLARGTGEALAPEPLPASDVAHLANGARVRALRAFAQLASRRDAVTGHAAERVDALLSRQADVLTRLEALAGTRIDATRTRVHQDYHLGQLLWTGARYALLDFEGEPARALAERRAKRSPLTDVAGMLRSYSYAAWSGLFAWSKAHGAEPSEREPWATLWETALVTTFLRAYFAGTQGQSFVPSDGQQLASLLELLMLDKGLYELDYELNNRPAWVAVPASGLLRLIATS